MNIPNVPQKPSFTFTQNDNQNDSPEFSFTEDQQNPATNLQTPNLTIQTTPGQQVTPQVKLNKVTTSPVSTLGENNFVNWLQTNHPQAFGHITDVKATVAKNAEGGLVWEARKFPEDYANGAKEPLAYKKTMKIKIEWEVQVDNGPPIKKTEYYDPGIWIPEQRMPSQMMDWQLKAAMITRGYVQMMKAPIKPDHPKYAKMNRLVNDVASGCIHLRIPPIKQLHNYSIIEMHVDSGTNKETMTYDFLEAARGTTNQNAQLRMEKVKQQAQASSVSFASGTSSINQSTAAAVKASQQTPANLIAYCQTNGLSLKDVTEGMKVMIQNDNENYNTFVESFDTEKKNFMTKALDSVNRLFGRKRKPDFPELEGMYLDLLIQRDAMQNGIQQEQSRLNALPANTPANDPQKVALENSIRTKEGRLESYKRIIQHLDTNQRAIRILLDNWKNRGQQLKVIEMHLAEQFATNLNGHIPANQQQHLNRILPLLQAGQPLSDDDEKILFQQIITPNSETLMRGAAVGNPAMTGEEAYQTMIEAREMRRHVVEGSTMTKDAQKQMIARKITAAIGVWQAQRAQPPQPNLTITSTQPGQNPPAPGTGPGSIVIEEI